MTDKRPIHWLQNRRNMIIHLGILLLIGFFGTSLISYLISRNAIRNSILNNELPLTSYNIYSEIQRDLIQPILISSLMAHDTFVQDWATDGEKEVEDIAKYLGKIKTKYKTITAFFVSEKTKNYYYPDGVLKKIKETEPRDKWYFRVREMQTPYEINVDPDLANRDTMTIFINYKVYDHQGHYIGTTGVGLAVSMVKKLINSYRGRFQRNVHFFNRRGELVLSSLESSNNDRKVSQISDIHGLKKLTPQILAGDLANFEYRETESDILLNVRFIPDLNWLLVVEQVEDNTGTLFKNIIIINLAICLVISIIVLGIIRFTISRYQKNLEDRNQELEEKNIQISHQSALLEEQTRQLSKSNKDLEAVNREKDEIIGITAHDLKSPLNGIVGFSELLSHESDLDEEAQQIAQFILETALKMTEQINNLMDVGQAESYFELKLDPFDFKESVLKTIEDFRYQAMNKKIKINTSFDDGPLITLANKKWITGIVGNLVSNALKYSPSNSSIELHLIRKNQTICFEVVDQGVGIPPEDLPHIFKKYSTAATNPTAGEKSTGLGLYIVEKMTRRMGGKTWCESELGKGSRFAVEFPVAQ